MKSHDRTSSDRAPRAPSHHLLAPRDWEGAVLAPPIAVYELTGEHGVVPVAVFVADGPDPELHVDARYLACAEARVTDVTFWRVGEALVAVRNERGLMGIVDGHGLQAGGRRS